MLNKNEVSNGLCSKNLSDPGEIDEIFDALDLDSNGTVEFTEFIAAMLDKRKFQTDEDKIKSAFETLDEDKSG